MRAAFLLAVLAAPLPGLSHHWIAGDYGLDAQDRYGSDAVQEYEGKVDRVLWGNPHPRIRLRVSATDELLFFEAGGLGVPEIRGLSRGIIEVGDQIKIAALPPTPGRGSRHLIVSVLLADNRELLMLATAERRWPDESTGVIENFDSSLAVNESNIASSESAAEGIFRVWTKQGPNITWATELPLTEAAREARATFDLDRDYPLMGRCESPGMPRAIIGNAWPIEFVDRGSEILLRMYEFDSERTILLNEVMFDAERVGIVPGPFAGPQGTVFGEGGTRVVGSPLGFSVGQWQGKTLVVRTGQIDWPFFDDSGLPQSDMIEVLERFTLSDDDTRLDYEITITDPEYFTEPVTGTKVWTWVPGQEIGRYDCVPDD